MELDDKSQKKVDACVKKLKDTTLNSLYLTQQLPPKKANRVQNASDLLNPASRPNSTAGVEKSSWRHIKYLRFLRDVHQMAGPEGVVAWAAAHGMEIIASGLSDNERKALLKEIEKNSYIFNHPNLSSLATTFKMPPKGLKQLPYFDNMAKCISFETEHCSYSIEA
jgi:hypothetical protein